MSDHDLRAEREVIDGYTRAGAIAGGALVPAPDDMAANAGFTCPVALTGAAWDDCVAWAHEDNTRKGTVQDEDGRLWDVLWMASRAIRAKRGGLVDRQPFTVYRVPRPGPDTEPEPVPLLVFVGPGDEGELVVTITQPEED